ncbi:tRNA uridine-5-carboxymethylaminomethyl(34) synthesis GTPase MnmE [Cellvibrio japonicus]|uniref:tRNA modification GTPase MnmE n=1 Tax=Cellvibrio japonicus (strain Ueda107) TaxID=498211 RepID=B3PIU0_CELJU|nr:tRNA uridine-5-carboxymethylaminomethyl(34) synthesis GTPase MnmE [Cellvibrio japonicus]ACE85281.1 tRNA modification GTPase TrmE [Cellvibrio japonicus Ueda107]QEI14001.1 tRNA uridine-5-carboxymethylaminomethyl(34) synthesis GTPase MnmE [Cellvibrio japonicus]QEI17575.1 tRNA uridine-5-carboxymethylaminomethyl(34) synthesis GTPase MnmE [Cellvibrio japonicus]QEI21151.1 tRNA uridine-5-carboxymethylaminomethyl(34) synthesis GTPase MnmE [Cellvibrio japonicus]
MNPNTDTIAAIATATGRGGVGIVRISGPKARFIAERLLGIPLQPRHAHFCDFRSHSGDTLDQGIALFFPNPHSFTGEDVLELQGHGGPVILDLLLREILQLGVRLARPGEFSERAFLNDKLDLAQAEAIADLIDATTEQAARNALHSLQGAFSKRIQDLVESLIHLRIYVEASIDFPEEEIDFLSDGKVARDLDDICHRLDSVFKEARQGALVRDGMRVVIAGRPNAGKSSLLNALSGRESAIVTPIEGTTRDVLREHIHIEGMPLHIIDTAGLRDSPDEVEQIGIQRAWSEIQQADRVLLLVDSRHTAETDPRLIWPEFVDKLDDPHKITLVRNKIDLSGEQAGLFENTRGQDYLGISAATGSGMDALKDHLKAIVGFNASGEGGFTARRRHLDALERAQHFLNAGQAQLQGFAAGELLAEDLRQAQHALGEITGEFTPDDLLGRIFSSFCIGK